MVAAKRRAVTNAQVREKVNGAEDGQFRKMVENLAISRWSLAGYLEGTNKRNIYKECGYPAQHAITPENYRDMYERNGVATRVNDVYPDECWALDPDVYETEDTQNWTEFELAWKQLTSSAEEDITNDEDEGRVNAMHYLHRIDQTSGVGSFGLLLMGLDDRRPLDKIVPGINERGRPSGQTVSHRLLYLRVFNQTQVTVDTWQVDPSNPRFGQPLLYRIKFADPASEAVGLHTLDGTDYKVHWSRVLHVADGRRSSEVFGTPRQKNVFNWLLDLEKVMGGSGEMFWKGGFPGISFESDPSLGGVALDRASIEEEVDKYQNGLQRWLALTGMQAKQLIPQVASPEAHIRGLLTAISISLGIPMRIFIGSEEAKLSSSQDSLAWNKRLGRRQARYLTPMLVRPFIDRLIIYGVLPRPKSYTVSWPDFNTLTDDEKASIAQKRSTALATYVSGNCEAVYPLEHYLVDIMGLPLAQAKIVSEAAVSQIRFTEDPNDVALQQTEIKADADVQKAKIKGDQAAQQRRTKTGPAAGGKNRAVKQPRTTKPKTSKAVPAK